ncbi:MAG: hypothetical protein DRP84_06225 [Spirochaetes bacterium]|nr:MAG: hypothetical protein DRP84_06225 [Spirochaetota bacterium]
MIILIIVLVGLCIASFIETTAYRVSRGISLIHPPSFCDSCQKRLKIYDLIPVVSYAILGGKCRYCKAKIPFRYLLIELLIPSLYVFIYLNYKNIYSFFLLSYLLTILTYMSMLDIDSGYISFIDIGLLYLGSIGLIVLSYIGLIPKGVSFYLYGALTGLALILLSFLIILLIKKKIPMGTGDLLVIPAVTIFFGFRGALTVLITASVSGLFIGIALILFGVVKRNYKFPMIPYITLGVIMEILLFQH